MPFLPTYRIKAITELTPEMLEENAPDYWAFINVLIT